MHGDVRTQIGAVVRRGLPYVGIALLLGYIGFPLYWTAISSLKTPVNFFEVQYWPVEPSLMAYRIVLADATFRRAIFVSLLVTFAVLAVTIVFGALAGYAIGRLRFRGRRPIRYAVLAMIVVPQVGLLPGLFTLIRSPCLLVGVNCPQFSLYNTIWALLATYPILTLPLTVWFAAAYYRDLPPDIEEAAQVDGATLFQSFVHLMLPLSAPALITTGLLAFITAWNEFLFPVTFTQAGMVRTAPVQLNEYGFMGFGTILTLAGSVVLMAPVVVLVLAFGPQITGGLAVLSGSVRHVAEPETERRGRRVTLDAGQWTLLGVLLLGALIFTGSGWDVIRFPHSVDYGEGPLLAQTIQLAHGQNIYRADLTAPPFTVANYPPLYMLTLAPLAALFGPAFWYGRLLSWLSMVTAALFVGLVLHHFTRDRLAALFGGLMLLAIPYVAHWAGLYRIDSLALALSLAALYVVVRTGAAGWGLPLTALLLVAAIFTRQSYGLAAPLAAFVWLLRSAPRRAFALAASVGGLGLVLFGLLNALTGGGLWFNIVVANINEFQTARLAEYLKECGTLMPIALVGTGLFLALGWRQRGWPLIAPYTLGAAVAALTIGKVGSNINYLLEFSAAICLALGAVVAALRSVPLARQVVLALLAVQFVLLVPGTRYQLFTAFRLEARDDLATVQTLIASTPGPILADEDMGALALDGRALIAQPFELTQLARGGVWDQRPLVSAIAAKQYALILIFGVPGAELAQDRWTPELLAAIADSYTANQQIGNTLIYRPKP